MADSNMIMNSIIEKLGNDISNTEDMLTNLRCYSAENENEIRFYTGRLAYMRELQSYISYLSKERN